MKRTYRKEVYEAHEMMRRSQVRRNIINRHCRRYVAIGRIVCIIIALAIIISSLIVNATSVGDNDELVEQAKTPEVTETKTELKSSVVLYSYTPSIGEDEIAQKKHHEDFPNYNDEEEAFPVIDLNKPNEEKVEEQPDNGNFYTPTEVTTTNEYPQIKE